MDVAGVFSAQATLPPVRSGFLGSRRQYRRQEDFSLHAVFREVGQERDTLPVEKLRARMKYHRLRDTRKRVDGVLTGHRMSCSIDAASAAEADAIFEERWALRTGETMATRAETKPAPVRKPWETEEALALKRHTPMFTT